MRIRKGSPLWRRMSVSDAVAIAIIPTTIRAMWISKIRWRGSAAYSAVMPAMPGPRPKPRRKKTPASAAASALLPRRAWSTTKAEPTPRNPPIASPCSTRPANSSGTDSARANTSDASVITAIAGQQDALAPEPVAQVAGDQHRRADRDRVGDEQERRRARREAEVLLVERQQRRQRARPHGEDEQPDQGLPRAGGHPAKNTRRFSTLIPCPPPRAPAGPAGRDRPPLTPRSSTPPCACSPPRATPA